MIGFRSTGLLAATALMGGLLASHPAAAQDAATLQSIEAQIAKLQAQLRQLQRQAAEHDVEMRKAREETAAARAEAQKAMQQAAQPPVSAATLAAPPGFVPPGSYPVYVPKPADPNKPNGSFSLGGVTVTLGGFTDLTVYDRSANQTRGTSTSFSGIPFAQSPNSHVSEFGMTAQQTRLSLQAVGKVDDYSTITGYVESDFNNGAGGANSVQSNSYTPRLRQAYVKYDYTPWNSYVLAGQTWSLATLFKKGLSTGSEFTPGTIDSAYLPGVTYLRVPALRVVGSFPAAGQKVSVGLELDSPQTVIGGTAFTPANTTITTTNAGNGGLNPQTNYSLNVAPDIIAKGAVDTAFGHYELYGLGRFFADRVSGIGNGATNITTGGGIGAAMYVPVKTWFDIAGNILYGYGIGRYGAGGMSDVTFTNNGSLEPLREVMGYLGIIGHVTKKLDIYGYWGMDQLGSKYFNVGKNSFGYGNPAFSNAGCDIENSPLTCTGNNYELSGLTAGLSWKVLQGGFGNVAVGLQYGYYERQAYRGTGGAPTGYENEVFANVRYTPFN
jgi:hypothetical protein